MNVSDSERIATILEKRGYSPNAEKVADLIIVNACSVRQKAVDRIWGKVKIWQLHHKKILLTGCVLPADRKKFAEKGIGYLNFYDDNFFDIVPKNLSPITYIPIMTGCDNFCSYCAVPYTRGREKSRPVKDILDDVKRALKDKSKEILLLGQNVNSYGKLKSKNSKVKTSTKKLKDNKEFIKLLKSIDNLPGNFKFNFISSNPHDMDDELIKTFAKLKKWPRELHLPLQSGDDEILHKMNRKYTSAQYLKLIENLKFSPKAGMQIENLSLTTDIIVGFPGETKKQFENTLKLCKKVKFDKAYIAQYSPRPGTAAAEFRDDVLSTEKKRRWELLDSLINKKTTACPVNDAL